MYSLTTSTKKISKLTQRLRGIAGGTSAGKTISSLQYLIDLAQTDTKPTLTSVVSESYPHLRRGAIRDFVNIMQDHGYFVQSRWNKSEATYVFETGSKIEFFSADMPSKVRGPRRDRLFLNEGNNVPYESFDQMMVRTKEFALIDWNPTNEFWWYLDILPNRTDIDFITLTYKDNEALDPAIVKDIESHRNNKLWWSVYGEGKLGEVEGKIFQNWKIIDEVPHEAKLVRYGLDFGYSNDPTAIVGIYYYNGGYILDEVTYQKGLSNKQIADILNNQPKALVMADSAEPKSIDEIKLYGVNILPVMKGAGSINQGIQYVQDQQISITKRSTNGIKENRNYMWMTDKDGKIINVPIDIWNHFMDATRYGFESLRPRKEHKIRDKPKRLKFAV